MLVLSRKKGQSIVIGDNIEITVVEIQGDVVRIGIKAPREVTVHRQEIFEQIREANQQAVQPSEGLPVKLQQLSQLSRQTGHQE